MCGLAGFWRIDANGGEDALAVVARMATTLTHRGPDDGGAWADGTAGIALGHRRLSIVDLSPAGHQPMHSPSDRYVIAFNGEIYNHLEIRAELETLGAVTQAWRGHSDTETLLAAIEHWGLELALQRAVGMFAFALWDQREQALHLARDRFGEKPLYYGWVGQGLDRALAFGSELKALRAYPGFQGAVCRQSLAQYLRFNYVPSPRSIYTGIYKLPPGCLLTARAIPEAGPPDQPVQPGESHGAITVTQYHSLQDVTQAGRNAPITSETDAMLNLEQTLDEAVGQQSLADVPLGAFLSGGVDSSLIVALMQRQAARHGSAPVQTFTIGFDEAGYNEAPFALAVARHLGTRHQEMRVTARDALDVIPRLPMMYDEPFADSSQIPTHLVCMAARQQVTVALSGDGGDEVFGGYNRYFWGPKIWSNVSWLPFPARQALGAAAAAVPVGVWDAMGGVTGREGVGDKFHKLAYRLKTVRDLDGLYASLVSEWPDPALLVRGLDHAGGEPPSPFADAITSSGSSQERMMLSDMESYLPDDILCKVDRAAMACGLETRAPFLDHRVTALAARLPLDMKIRGNESKWALRQILYRHVPRALIERPKAGFAIPVGQWLRGPLREWAEHLLSSERLERDGYFHPAPIRQAWEEHLSGRRVWTGQLWGILMFQAWLDDQSGGGL